MEYNIIIICGYNSLKERPDKLDYYFFNYLQNNSKYNIQFIEPIKEKLNEIIKENSILILFTCHLDLSDYKNYKIYWIYDMNCTCKYGCDGKSHSCKFNKEYNNIYSQNYDKVWYKYLTSITRRLITEKPNYHLKFPHMMFDPNIHKDYQLEKKYDILFYGATDQSVYPFRNRLHHILYKNADKFNVLFLPYTKKHPDKMTTWIDLYKLISSSWLTISCCAISEVLVAKYFEIGLCGSVICGDYPSQEDELFIKNNMILLDRNMSNSEIIVTIQQALSDKNKLRMYSENLKKYISEKYMYKNGLELFESYIKSITE